MVNIEEDKLKQYLEKTLNTKIELDLNPNLIYTTTNISSIANVHEASIRYYLDKLPEYIKSTRVGARGKHNFDAKTVFRIYLIVLYTNKIERNIDKIRYILGYPPIESNEKMLTEKVTNFEVELKDGMSSEIRNELKNELKHELKNEIRYELKNELKNELKHELKNEIKNELKNELKNVLKEELKNTSLIKNLNQEKDSIFPEINTKATFNNVVSGIEFLDGIINEIIDIRQQELEKFQKIKLVLEE